MRPGGGALISLAALALAACTSSVGQLLPDVGADVMLHEKNYRVLKAHAVGQSSGVWLFSVLPITSPTYGEAKQRLDESVGQRLEGRAIALTNRSVDRSTMNAILYSVETITLTADVIEFEDRSAPPAAR